MYTPSNNGSTTPLLRPVATTAAASDEPHQPQRHPYVRYDLVGSSPDEPPPIPPELQSQLGAVSTDSQEQIWKQFWIQLHPHIRHVARLESRWLRFVVSCARSFAPLLVFAYSAFDLQVFPVVYLIAWSIPIVFALIKDRLVCSRIEAIRAVCNVNKARFECFANGCIPECEATLVADGSGTTVPSLYFVATDKLCRRYDISNNLSLEKDNCEAFVEEDNCEAFVENAIHDDWIEFWSQMTNTCKHRMLYSYLPLSIREFGFGLLIVAALVPALQRTHNVYVYVTWIAATALLVYFFYDVNLYAQQVLAKRHVVHEFSSKFAQHNVRLEMRAVNEYHKWWGVSIQHHVCFFFPSHAGNGLLVHYSEAADNYRSPW
jgi:hypothetical protein